MNSNSLNELKENVGYKKLLAKIKYNDNEINVNGFINTPDFLRLKIEYSTEEYEVYQLQIRVNGNKVYFYIQKSMQGDYKVFGQNLSLGALYLNKRKYYYDNYKIPYDKTELLLNTFDILISSMFNLDLNVWEYVSEPISKEIKTNRSLPFKPTANGNPVERLENTIFEQAYKYNSEYEEYENVLDEIKYKKTGFNTICLDMRCECFYKLFGIKLKETVVCELLIILKEDIEVTTKKYKILDLKLGLIQVNVNKYINRGLSSSISETISNKYLAIYNGVIIGIEDDFQKILMYKI